MPMKKTIATLVLAAAGLPVQAQEVYMCVDQNGVKEYKNTGVTKGCKKVDLPDLTIAAPYKRTAPTTTAKASQTTTPTPGDFPRVDSGTQKARDNDRRQILGDEMKAEEQKLADLKREFNNGEPERRGDERNYAKYQERVGSMKEDMARVEKNIEALKREMSNIR